MFNNLFKRVKLKRKLKRLNKVYINILNKPNGEMLKDVKLGIIEDEITRIKLKIRNLEKDG